MTVTKTICGDFIVLSSDNPAPLEALAELTEAISDSKISPEKVVQIILTTIAGTLICAAVCKK